MEKRLRTTALNKQKKSTQPKTRFCFIFAAYNKHRLSRNAKLYLEFVCSFVTSSLLCNFFVTTAGFREFWNAMCFSSSCPRVETRQLQPTKFFKNSLVVRLLPPPKILQQQANKLQSCCFPNNTFHQSIIVGYVLSISIATAFAFRGWQTI